MDEIKIGSLCYNDSQRLAKLSWTTMREHILRRDRFQCQICGDRLPLPFDGQLFVHHITHRAQKGTDNFENLITLCDLCHGVIHGYYRWFGVHEMAPAERKRALDDLKGSTRENYEWFLHLPHEERKRIQSELWSTWGIMKPAPANDEVCHADKRSLLWRQPGDFAQIHS